MAPPQEATKRWFVAASDLFELACSLCLGVVSKQQSFKGDKLVANIQSSTLNFA